MNTHLQYIPQNLYLIAEKSECSRRKYGALIITTPDGLSISSGYNQRVGSCCNGACVRDELAIEHGRNTDAGAEIHAEQAALVKLSYPSFNNPMFSLAILVAGLDKDGQPMNGFDNAPCYSCARMIKYAGIQQVYLPVDGDFERFDIEDIMETWERSWEAAA